MMSSGKQDPNHANDTWTSAENSQAEQLMFLDPLTFFPTWQQRGNLAERSLGMLLQWRKVDQPEFEAATPSWQLAAVVFDSCECAWLIGSMELPSPTEENPHRYIYPYHLPEKYIAKALAISGRKT